MYTRGYEGGEREAANPAPCIFQSVPKNGFFDDTKQNQIIPSPQVQNNPKIRKQAKASTVFFT